MEDPLKILISEILLRKTNAEKVGRYFPETIPAIGTLEDLQQIELIHLEDLLRPFGMHRKKAAELKALADELRVQHAGQVPRSEVGLRSLPGVGPYIARSVLCYAFGENVAVVDTNVIRVLQRYFAVEARTARPRDDIETWKVADDLVAGGDARKINLALIDFAKQVCRAHRPLCRECPVATRCYAYREGIVGTA